ncbi:MAG: glycosyl hydrolase-related protein [Armatimonadetes bacterium]|nr:glycosyl hydrolase-related protein [Armatimonadota bacterium]
MSSHAELGQLIAAINTVEGECRHVLERFKAEYDFALRMLQAHPEKESEWAPLLEKAARVVLDGIQSGQGGARRLVEQAEQVLAPLGQAAKEYVVYCVGHAHIDMNWMWSWPETVAVCYDTFSTMDKLMDEFPEFRFSQSQASVYYAMRKYAPELFERIKQRIAEGRWEVTASQWVEGDKNLASGEILCRHLLYTRRWVRENLGLDFDAVKIDWECDTFGHCWTLPGILRRGGVTRYYHHRASGLRLRTMAAGATSQLFWWEGKDGSRILAYDDSPNGYNGEITPWMTHLLFDMERHTGLKKLMWVYGVGDHGGGPTRRHLRAAQDMAMWPIWPQVKLATTDEYFSAVEEEIAARGLELPVHEDELNFVFEGCYTSESRIKFANRVNENDLVDTEIVAVIARNVCGMEYPDDALVGCWRRAMFLQFHDILPGSGVKETVEYAMGLFQENLATTNMIRTRSLRALAEKVDTSALAPKAEGSDLGLGAGAGEGAWWGGVSSLGAGQAGGDVFLIFNPAPFARDELVQVKVWNRELADGAVVVRDAQGNTVAGQIIERGHYWGHNFVTVAFPVTDLPAMGYRGYAVEPGTAPADEGAYVQEMGRPVYGLGYVNAQLLKPVLMGNEYLEMVISGEHGGIISLVDKETGTQFVLPGAVLGAIEREQEAPHSMTAWQLGAIVDHEEPLAPSVLEVLHKGPHLATVRLTARHKNSDYRLTISLARDSRQINFTLDVNWLERGDPTTGVPALRASFPLLIEGGEANFEIPFGTIQREADGEEAPALTWVDLTGTYVLDEEQEVGATLVNDSKYGHQLSDDTIRLTLLRSSYDPDPLPELGAHQISYGLIPHAGPFDPVASIRAGYAFNHRPIVVGTTAHTGDLPAEAAGIEILTPNVMVSAVKKAEDSDAVVIRLFEIEGKETKAQVRLSRLLAPADGPAVETDLLERPVEKNTASRKGDVVSVKVPPFGIATVKIG